MMLVHLVESGPVAGVRLGEDKIRDRELNAVERAIGTRGI